MAKVQDEATLDISDYIKKLHTIDQNIAKMAGHADKSFGGVGKIAGASGIQIGLISGVVSSLTTEFINLGQQAVGALVDIAKEGTQTALEFDTLRSRLLGIFDGSKPAAEEAFDFIQKKSKELGIDLSELAGAFLPKVESLEQFERVAKIATALARSDPNGTGGPVGARIALQEAISGDFISLQKRFEFDDSEIKKVKDAFADTGIDGFLTALEEVQQASGRAFGDFANTAEGAFQRVNIQLEQLKGALGVPIVEELKGQFKELFDILDDDKFTVIATTIGQMVAEVLDFMSSGFVQELSRVDPEGFITLAENVIDLLGSIKLLAATVFDLPADFSAINGPIEALAGLVELINNEMRNFAIGIALAKGGIDAIVATAPKLVGIVQALSALGKVAQGNIVAGALEAKEALENLQSTTLFDPEAGKDAWQQSLQDLREALKEVDAGSAESKQKLQELLDKLGQVGDTGAADAFLGDASAARELAAAAEEATAAQAKIDEARAKAQKDYQQDLLEADIKFERARTDALLDGQRKREDAAKQNLQKIADIEKKNKQGRTDSETDLDRDIEDIHRKHSREKIEQRKDEAQKIIDLETDTRRKISDIIDRSQIDLDEAEQRRDAVSFLRILKQRNLDIAEAQKDTARAVQDTRTEGERKRDELKIQQQQEIADAKLAHDRRLEDLQTALSRELEAQATAYDREREQIATNEQRKLDDLVLARERDREDALRHYQEKLADLEISMAAELETIKKFHAMEEEEAARHAAAMAAAEAEAKRQTRRDKVQSQANADDDTPSSRPGQQNRQRQRAGQPNSRPGFQNRGRAFGGLVNAGQSYPVGERGPELFTPNANGRIIPNSALVMPNFSPRSTISNINNSRQLAADINLTDPSQLSPIQVAIVKNVVLDILNSLS